MKKQFLPLLSSFIVMCLLNVSMTTHAQQLRGCPPAEQGTYYLYNLGRKAFIYGDNDWGTRASLTQQGGIPVTLLAGENADRFYISTSPTYENLFLGYDGYLNKNITDTNNYSSWLFTPVEGMENVYTLKATKNDKYWLAGRASDNKTERITSAPTNDYGYWMLLSRDEMLANLAEATPDNPKDATWALQNPYLGCKTDPTCWNSVTTNAQPKFGGETDNNYCIEGWDSNFNVFQTLEGMPNGVYTLQIQGFYRIGDGTDNATAAATARGNGYEKLNATYYINDFEAPVKSIFDYSKSTAYSSSYNASAAYDINGTNYYVPNTLARAAYCFRKGEYWNEPLRAVVTDGKLTVGVHKSVTNSKDWTVFDNFVLTYLGAVEDMSATIQRAKNAWHNKYDAIVEQALDHSAFNQVIDNADTYCTSEERLAEYHEMVWQTVVNILKTGTTATGQFDITSLVTNPDFDTDTHGWTTDATLGYHSDGVAEVWNKTDLMVFQTLTAMPAGTYTLKAQALYRPESWRPTADKHRLGVDNPMAQIFLGNSSKDVRNICEGSRFKSFDPVGDRGGDNYGSVPNSMHGGALAFANGLYWNILSTTTVSDDNLSFGFSLTGGKGDNWLLFDNVRLYYGQERTEVNLSRGLPAEDTQASTVSTGITLSAGEYNKVCLPFSLTAKQTAEAFKAAYQLAGVTEYGVGQLLPVETIEAGKAYFVTVDSTKTLSISDVMVSVAKPDSIPVMWEGAATVGNYETFSFDINAAEGFTLKTYEPIDFQNLAFKVDMENWRTRRFLNEFTYPADGSVSSKIRAYNYAYPTPLDHPHSVYIPVPRNDAPLTLTLYAADKGQAYTETFCFAAGTTCCELPNLIPQTTYAFKVTADGSVISQGQFELTGNLRQIKTQQGFNIRDLGGWLTQDGRRTHYGKVFRGGELNFGHTLSKTDIAELQRIGIGAEIDWRRYDEVDNTTPSKSVLSTDEADYLYLNHDYLNMSYSYDVNKQHYKQAFTFMLSKLREGKAVYFHCRIGADRTGQYALLLDGLSGLTFDGLCKEYELTSFSEAGTREWNSTGVQNLRENLQYVQSLPGQTLQEQFIYYMNHEVGVDIDDILEFIAIMTGSNAETLIISENSTEVPHHAQQVNVTLERTFQAAGSWNTLAVPFDLSEAEIQASALNGATIFAFESSDATSITFKEVTSMEAGQPYLVRLGGEEAVLNPTFKGVNTVETDGTCMGEDGCVQFVGQTYNKALSDISNICYLSTSGKVKSLEPGGIIKGLRAYFIVPTGAEVKMSFKGLTDGIQELSLSARDKTSEGIYDISGKQVSQRGMGKGIYVVNGKTTVVH